MRKSQRARKKERYNRKHLISSDSAPLGPLDNGHANVIEKLRLSADCSEEEAIALAIAAIESPGVESPASSLSDEISLNSLLNFSFPPREFESEHSAYSPPPQARRARKPIRYEKDRFRTATYRFAIAHECKEGNALPGGEKVNSDALLPKKGEVPLAPLIGGRVAASIENVDFAVPWEQVCMVLHSDTEEFLCSICLDTPVAPRMTLCGHIFCLPCLLHYFDEERTVKWKPCPVCFEPCSASKEHVRPVLLSLVNEAKKGAMVSFSLVRRADESIVVMETDDWTRWNGRSGMILPHAGTRHAGFTRLSVVEERTAFFMENGKRELDQLYARLRRAKSELDKESARYFELAMQRTVTESGLHGYVPARGGPNGRTGRSHEDSLSDDVGESKGREEVNGQDLSTDPSNEVSAEAKDLAEVESVAFYQDASGQYVFVGGLTHRMLLEEFESVSNFPLSITARVLATKDVCMDDAARRRYRFLSHIPRTCTVRFCTLDLAGIVSESVIEKHRKELPKEEEPPQEACAPMYTPPPLDLSEPVFPTLRGSLEADGTNGTAIEGNAGEEVACVESTERAPVEGCSDQGTPSEEPLDSQGTESPAPDAHTRSFKDALMSTAAPSFLGAPSSLLCADPVVLRNGRGQKKRKKKGQKGAQKGEQVLFLCNASARGYKC